MDFYEVDGALSFVPDDGAAWEGPQLAVGGSDAEGRGEVEAEGFGGLIFGGWSFFAAAGLAVGTPSQEAQTGDLVRDVARFTRANRSAQRRGPARLIALMTLAINAHALGHPRASHWIAAATSGMPSVPPSVFSENLRAQWSGVVGG